MEPKRKDQNGENFMAQTRMKVEKIIIKIGKYCLDKLNYT